MNVRRWVPSVLVLVATVMVVELVGLLAFEEIRPVHTLQPDDELGWVLPPSSSFEFVGQQVTTNARGWRGPLPGDLNVAVVGDSSAFGHGVADDETFAALLDERLDATVLNLGVPGYTCRQVEGLVSRVPEVDALLVYAMHSDVFPIESGDRMVWLPGGVSTTGWGRIIQAGVLARKAGRPRTPVPEFEACLERMSQGRPAVFVAPIATSDLLPVTEHGDPSEHLRPWRDAMRRVAGDHYVDLPAQVRGWGEGAFADDVHPSAAGHRRIAEALVDPLAAIGVE